MKSKFFIFLLLATFSFSFADKLIVKKDGNCTYVQEEKFMLAEGENVIGPINLLPIINTRFLRVSLKDGYLVSYVINNYSKNWKENLKGKTVSVEGEGRFIVGRVVDIQGDNILINTSKGLVITTFPKFPGKISLKGKFSETFSPTVNLKIYSKNIGEKIIKIIYPVKGIIYKIHYLAYKNKLTPYFVIKNNTPIDFNDIDLVIKGKLFTKVIKNFSIPAYSQRVIRADLKHSEYEEGLLFRYKNDSIQYIKVYRK